MIATQSPEPVNLPEYRFADNDTMRNKLMYQIRTGNMNADAMDGLRSQCAEELHRLRSELEQLLRELRESVSSAYRADRESIAA